MELPHWSEYGYPEDVAINVLYSLDNLSLEQKDELKMQAIYSKRRREQQQQQFEFPTTIPALPLVIRGLKDNDISNEWKWDNCIYYYEKPLQRYNDKKKDKEGHIWKRSNNCFKDSEVGIKGGSWRREISYYDYFDNNKNNKQWRKDKKGKQYKAGVILHREDDDRYLLVQSYGHSWGYPQGTVENEDSFNKNQPSFCEDLLVNHPEKAKYIQMCTGAFRELKEETGLNINKTTDMIMLNGDPFFYSKVKGIDILNPYSIGVDNTGYEITGIGWFTKDEMSKLRLNKNTSYSLNKKLLQFGKKSIIFKGITKSTRSDKKYMATFINNGRTKVIHFGASGMSDYTKHKDDDRKKRYINRHKKRENWNNPMTAGALSRWILWNKKTLQSSINDYKKRFNFT